MGKNKDKLFNNHPIGFEEPITEFESITEPVAEEKETIVDGYIDGVDMALNIRNEPEVKANNQVAILGKGTKIKVVDPHKPVENRDGWWYKVLFLDGNKEKEGYAMKKFIKVVN